MDGDEGLLCDSTFEFGEAVLTAIASECDQTTGNQQEEQSEAFPSPLYMHFSRLLGWKRVLLLTSLFPFLYRTCT